MRIAVIDITNKVPLYNAALIKALKDAAGSNDVIDCFTSESRLLSIVPHRIENSKNIAKRAFKAVETILNWIYLLLVLYKKKYDVVHFQWLPFMEISNIELQFLRILKRSGNKKLILTIHNVYPHGRNSEAYKTKYALRFRRAAMCFDKFIVHTNHTKKQVIREFDISEEKIFVVHHGIFEHKAFPPEIEKGSTKKYSIIMYGNQDIYKGTDIFVDALSLLPKDLKPSVKATILGRMDDEMYNYVTQKEKDLDIEIIPRFVSEEELYSNIAKANLIVLPYRDISQSGVLLLALSFHKCILTSDLPSFKETLEGFQDDMFFETGNAQSMAYVLEKYIRGEIEINMQLKAIDSLNKKYSWESAGQLTYNIYQK